MILHRHLLLVFLLWIHYSPAFSSRGPPKILGRDFKPLQVVRVGQEFRVACPIEGDPSPIIDWFKDGEPITAAWSRFRVSSKALRIRTVNPKDSGIYECKGVNGFGSIIARTRLVVSDDSVPYSENTSDDNYYSGSSSYSEEQRSGPSFTPETLEQSGPLHVSSGNNIRFKCETKGTPASKLMWFKDGKSVNEKMSKWSTWTLTLSKLTSEDSGSYTCKASNVFGKNEFTIQLETTEMMERRKPTIMPGYPNNVTVLSGNEGMMECVVRGDSTAIPPHIKWLKRVPPHHQMNGETMKNKLLIPVQNLQENQHVLVIQDSEDEGIRVNETQINGTFISKLIFKQAIPGVHDGIYVCWATNSVGYTYQDAHLTILAGAEIVGNSSSVIPFPLVVFILSTALSLLVISSACCLRNYQKTQQKQSHSQSLSVRKLSSPSSVGSRSSASASASGCGSSYPSQKHCSGLSMSGPNSSSARGAATEQRQLLVVPTVNMKSLHQRSLGQVMCHSNMMRSEPAIEIALSRCSYCGDESSEISAVRTYEHCYNGSYVSSTSHSLHCGPWT